MAQVRCQYCPEANSVSTSGLATALNQRCCPECATELPGVMIMSLYAQNHLSLHSYPSFAHGSLKTSQHGGLQDAKLFWPRIGPRWARLRDTSVSSAY